MNQKFEPSLKLKEWLTWMEAIHDEIHSLVVDANMFWEVQDIIRENPRTQKPSAFYRYFGRSHLSHALAGLRRQIKPQKDSISIVGLLHDIAKNPEELSREYFRSRCAYPDGSGISQNETESSEKEGEITGTSHLKHLINMGAFGKFADASGKHVCPKMVEADLKRLKSTVAIHQEFADKRIAHWDKDDREVIPAFGELDEPIKLLDETYVKYHLLFYAESIGTFIPPYQYEWKTIFLEPWLKTGFGSAKGLIHIREDFDDVLPDFKEYME